MEKGEVLRHLLEEEGIEKVLKEERKKEEKKEN